MTESWPGGRIKGTVAGGKMRKYYTITEQGAEVLRKARGKIRELVDEVLEED